MHESIVHGIPAPLSSGKTLSLSIRGSRWFRETHLAASNIRAAATREFHRIGYRGTLHSLRDFALTSFAQAGATIAEIMHRGGHRDFRAAMAYQQSTGRDRELARQAEAFLDDQTLTREDRR